MKEIMKYCVACILLAAISSCSGRGEAGPARIPSFPYQAYLDSMTEDSYSPTIGDDGDGFSAISHNIRYPEMPDSLKLSHFADTLLQFYNTALAFNTMAYDVSTAERYMSENDFGLEQADALDSINLSGIENPEIRDALAAVCRKAAEWIREGKKPNEQQSAEVPHFYELYNGIYDPFIKAHISDAEYSPADVLENYDTIHAQAVSDTASFRAELLRRVLTEQDFEKRCILAREFAYANYNSPAGDDKELVAVLDQILREEAYSPLLGELWLMWRTALQKGIFAGPSNDSAMYNLFYNDMRNRVALAYIARLKTHPQDRVAFNAFCQLVMTHNIVRNSPGLFGNNSMLDTMMLYDGVWNKDK